MKYLPAFLDLKGRRALVVGGGGRALPKIRLLRRAGATVVVIAPVAGEDVAALAKAGEIEWCARRFSADDVRAAAIVYAATGSAEIDQAVVAAACNDRVPVNVVDRPDLSTFIMPAIVDRDPLIVGISSGAAAPVLARLVRARIEALLPSRLGVLARFAEGFRDAVKAVVPAPQRRGFWERFFDGPIAAHVLVGEEDQHRRKCEPL